MTKEEYIQVFEEHGNEKCGGCGQLTKSLGMGCEHCNLSKARYRDVKAFLDKEKNLIEIIEANRRVLKFEYQRGYSDGGQDMNKKWLITIKELENKKK